MASSSTCTGSQRRHYEDDDLVVNFQDACIYGRDLKLLENPQAWLNDACIHYFLKRLHENYKNNSNNNNDTTICMDPAVLSFLMHQCDMDDPDDLADFCRGYQHFQGINRAFLPINDNLAQDSTSWQIPSSRGTHWSLLLAVEQQQQNPTNQQQQPQEQQQLEPHIMMEKNEPASGSSLPFPLTFYHFDSIAGHNSAAALSVAQRWQIAWSTAKKISHNNNYNRQQQPQSPPSPLPLVPVHVEECQRTPQQANGYDCGLHLLAAVEALLPSSPTTTTTVSCDDECLVRYFQDDSPAAVCAQLRRRMAQDIRAMARK